MIVGVETEREWKAHHRSFIGNLAPKGSVEYAITYRIALNFWRLGRLTKAETAAISLAIQEDPFASAGNGSDSVSSARAMVETFERWIKAADNEPIETEDAQALLSAWPYEYDEEEEDEFTQFLERAKWSCGELRKVFAGYAQRDNRTLGSLLEELRAHLRSAIRTASADARRDQTKAAQEVSRNLLPPPDMLDRLIDYERHLVGMIRRDFNHLERVQALRASSLRPAFMRWEQG